MRSAFPVLLLAALLLAGCKKASTRHTLDAASSAPTPSPAPDASPVPGAGAMRLAPLYGPGRRAIDVHTHLGPDAYGLMQEIMARQGIGRVINLSGGHGSEFRAANLEAARAFEDRVLLFANLPWRAWPEAGEDFPQVAVASLEEAARAGFAGVKVAKALGLGVEDEAGARVAVDDARLEPVWRAAGRLGLPVAIHTGDPKAFWEKPGPQNERHAELSLAPGWSYHGKSAPSREALLAERDRLLARHPETTFILVHLANNPEDIDYVDRLLDKYPHALVDIAARVGEFGRHGAERMRRFLVKHQDRVLFGTDIMLSLEPLPDGRVAYNLTLGSIAKAPPTLDDVDRFYRLHWEYFEGTEAAIDHPVPIQGDWKVHPVGLSEEVLEKIYFANAERRVVAPWLGRRVARGVVERARAAHE